MTRVAFIRMFCAAGIAVATSMLCSCEHKDLRFNHPEHATRYETRIEASYDLIWEMREPGGVDWSADWPSEFGISYESLAPKMPDGLCVNSYNRNGQKSSRHLPPKGGIVEMSPGMNSLLMYNDDTEFIIFDDLNNSVSAKATTRSRSRASYTGNTLDPASKGEPEKTVSPPDPLFGHYIEAYEQLAIPIPETLNATLRPLVFSYLIRYEFTHGTEYIGLARGAMSGMAESVFLFDGHTGDDRVTILYDCTVHDWGVETVVNSFGIPNYPNHEYSRTEDFYGLNLELRLRNGKMLVFDHDVTDQVAAQPPGGVIVIKGLCVSDEDGNEAGSGFDVDVEGWGDFEDITIDL